MADGRPVALGTILKRFGEQAYEGAFGGVVRPACRH